MDLLELLAAADVESFNAERGTRRKLEFFAAELDGLDLTGVDLEAVSLEKSDMTGTRLEDASLARANLAGIDGGEMSFRGAIGPRIKLREAWLEEADLAEADFTKGDLKEACLVRTSGSGLVGTAARFVEVDAREARWSGCFLGEASLSGSNFAAADLSRSDLTDASAHGADFTGARLDAILVTRFRATEVNLTGASLVGTRLDHANLAGANLTNANLTGADLRHCNLAGATLTGASLQGVSLVGANLEDVDFTDIDLTGVDLSGIDPVLLGLSAAQIAQATAVGAADLSHAPRRYEDAVAAANSSQTCVLWVNVDGEEIESPTLDPDDEFGDPADAPVTPRSVRWTLVGSRGKLHHGALALDAQGILGTAVLPRDSGFDLWLIARRPGGVQAGTEYSPQQINTPNLASENHCGVGRASKDSQSAS